MSQSTELTSYRQEYAAKQLAREIRTAVSNVLLARTELVSDLVDIINQYAVGKLIQPAVFPFEVSFSSNYQHFEGTVSAFHNNLSNGNVANFLITQEANQGGEFLRLLYTVPGSTQGSRIGRSAVPLSVDYQFPLAGPRLLESKEREAEIRDGKCRSIVKRWTRPPVDGVYWYKTNKNTILRYQTKNSEYRVMYTLVS